MSKSLLSSLGALILSLFLVNGVFAVKHTVNVQNFSFNPANLNVQVGDTIRWVWVNGSHTTTSTTIPGSAAAWDEPIDISNTSYEYKVTVAGVYNYLCTPHASSMTATFTAVAPSPTLSVTPSNRNVSASAGSINFTVTSNSNWTAVSNAGWCTVTSAGSGNGTITANYQANPLTTQRVATITVSVMGLPNSIVTVTQAGAAIILSVTPLNQDVTAQAGSTTFNITCNANWSVTTSDPWVSATADGSGSGIIAVDYEENTSNDVRVATLIVGAPDIVQLVTVTQEGAIGVIDNPLPGISVYPNPSNGILFITADQTGGNAQLRVIDTKGNVMIDRTIASLSTYTLDASSIGKGTYLLRLDQNGKTFVTRIVLVK